MATPTNAWLANSCKARLAEARKNVARCRAAYKTDPYKSAAERLAATHEKVAEIWEKLLDDLWAEREQPYERRARERG